MRRGIVSKPRTTFLSGNDENSFVPKGKWERKKVKAKRNPLGVVNHTDNINPTKGKKGSKKIRIRKKKRRSVKRDIRGDAKGVPLKAASKPVDQDPLPTKQRKITKTKKEERSSVFNPFAFNIVPTTQESKPLPKTTLTDVLKDKLRVKTSAHDHPLEEKFIFGPTPGTTSSQETKPWTIGDPFGGVFQPPDEEMKVTTMDEEMEDQIEDGIDEKEERKQVKEEKFYYDIDELDRDDPQQVIEYIDDIFPYLKQKENSSERPDPHYMNAQKSINISMRAVVVNWMASVCRRFGLISETFLLSVYILDRFLTLRAVRKVKLQLVGIGCILIASKFEEIYCPCIKDFIVVSAHSYSRNEILKMERFILKELGWLLSYPNPLHFLRRYSKASQSDSKTHTLSKYIAELAVSYYSMLEFKPSVIAASSVFIARAMTAVTPLWTPTLEHYTEYSAKDLRPCIAVLNKAVRSAYANGKNFKSLHDKYSDERLFSVATIKPVTFKF